MSVPEGLADMSGKDLAAHIKSLRQRIEQQSADWDGLLAIVGDVLEELEERLDSSGK
jgi:hypothetical protein